MTSLNEAPRQKTAPARESEWELDPTHVAVQFAVKHMMVTTVRGGFKQVKGTIRLDEGDLTKSSVEVVIDTASIDSHMAARDEHLRSADFLDVATYPTLTFRSTLIEKRKGGGLRVTGDLTIKDVTRSVTLDVEEIGPALKNPWGKLVRGVSATGVLHRKDFGLTWNAALESGGVLVGDEVKLQIDAELVAKAANN
jgi:polyisoprenoid-binding protein YceI